MSILRTGSYLVPSIPVDFFEAILQYLESKLKLSSTLLYESHRHRPNLDVEDPFKTGYLDLAWMTSLAYSELVENQSPVKLLPITSVHKHQMGRGCYADVVIHKDLRDVAKDFLDLRGYGFAFDVPGSLSEIISHLNLRNLGENMSFFKGIYYSGSNLESIKAVIAKKMEAAVVDANSLAFYLDRNPLMSEEIEVLTSWGPLPPYAWVVRSSLPDKLVTEIANTLCSMHKDEEGLKLLSNFKFNVDSFKPVSPKDLQKAANLEKQFNSVVNSSVYY